MFEDSEGDVTWHSQIQLYQTILRRPLRRLFVRIKLMASEEDADLEKQLESDIVPLGKLAWKCLLNDYHTFSENKLDALEKNDEYLGVSGQELVYWEESLKGIQSTT